MFHLILIALIGALTLGCWNLVHSQPRVLSMLMPRGVTIGFGVFLLVTGMFAAFASAYALKDANAMLSGLVQAYVGVWLVLAPSSGLRGSWADRMLMRRFFTMLILMVGVIVATYYFGSPQAVGIMSLLLIAAGIGLSSNLLRVLGRDR